MPSRRLYANVRAAGLAWWSVVVVCVWAHFLVGLHQMLRARSKASHTEIPGIYLTHALGLVSILGTAVTALVYMDVSLLYT